MSKQPRLESLMTKKTFSLVLLSIIFVCLSMVTSWTGNSTYYKKTSGEYNASKDLYDKRSLNIRLKKIADSGIEFCNNTYEFICTNFPSSSKFDKVRNREELELKLKGEFDEGHHPLLQLANRTLEKCKEEMTPSDLRLDPNVQEDWSIVSEIVNDLGGWPLFKNASRVSWNSSSYNWIDTICELRKIGLPSVLLELSVIPNPKKVNDKNETDGGKQYALLKLDIITNDYFNTTNSIIIENQMVHLVRMFHLFQPHEVVLDEPTVRAAYKRVVGFAEKLSKFTEDLPKDSPSQIYTIEEITKQTVPIDWLKLINRLSGRPKNVIDNDLVQVAFPRARKLKKFMQFIEDSPKDVLANYIIWSVVYELVPYLLIDVSHALAINVPYDFCITEIEKRFELSPMGFLADEESFPPEFRGKINMFLDKLKVGAIKFIQRRTLIRNITETRMIEAEAQKLKVQIARPEEYYNKTELDARLDPALMDSYYYGINDIRHLYQGKIRLLTLIILLNRINDFVIFNKVAHQMPVAFDLEYIKSYSITYLRKRNLIFVPRVVFLRLYSEHLAEYLNWARLGTTILSYYFNKFEEHREFRRENNYTEIMEQLLTECYTHYVDYSDKAIRDKFKNNRTRLLEYVGKQSAKQVLAGEAVLWLLQTRYIDEDYDYYSNYWGNYTPDSAFWTLMASTFCFRNESYAAIKETEVVFYTLFQNTFYKEEYEKLFK